MADLERSNQEKRAERRAEHRQEMDKLNQERVKLFVSWGWTEAKARQYIELEEKNFMLVWNLQYAGGETKLAARQFVNNHSVMIGIEENYNQD